MFSEIVTIKIPNFQGQIARARVNDFVRRETFTRSTVAEMYHRVNTISLRKYLKKISNGELPRNSKAHLRNFMNDIDAAALQIASSARRTSFDKVEILLSKKTSRDICCEAFRNFKLFTTVAIDRKDKKLT